MAKRDVILNEAWAEVAYSSHQIISLTRRKPVDNEEIVVGENEEVRQYVMTEGGGYIAHFRDWDDVMNFVQISMRAEILSISRKGE